MIETPIAIAATAAVGLSFPQPALGQSNGSPTYIVPRGPPAVWRELRQLQREERRWVET